MAGQAQPDRVALGTPARQDLRHAVIATVAYKVHTGRHGRRAFCDPDDFECLAKCTRTVVTKAVGPTIHQRLSEPQAAEKGFRCVQCHTRPGWHEE
jgi:hypothetical protein